ncbi:MAG: hypothetical protein JWO11_3537 [Nocardioides sp.]|nr:hypothetical protein [Nocardioides sp.]
MGDRLILCPPAAKTLPDGTRPGPCHIYGSCADLSTCEPSGRCHFGIPIRTAPAPTESETL